MPDILDACKKWASEYVVGLALCPFAPKPLAEGRISWVVEHQLENMITHIDHFLTSEAESLIIVTTFADDFYLFLDLFSLCHDILKGLKVNREIQLVSFHPDHAYEGSLPDDEVNFANRSPYPMIQLLRTRQLEEIGMTPLWKSEILEKNEDTLQQIGSEKLKEMLDGYRGKN